GHIDGNAAAVGGVIVGDGAVDQRRLVLGREAAAGAVGGIAVDGAFGQGRLDGRDAAALAAGGVAADRAVGQVRVGGVDSAAAHGAAGHGRLKGQDAAAAQSTVARDRAVADREHAPLAGVVAADGEAAAHVLGDVVTDGAAHHRHVPRPPQGEVGDAGADPGG